MELLIKIPKEFEQHFKQDAFEDSLHRLSADAHLIAGIYEQETAKMLRDAFKSAVSVPPHGRLGDLDALIADLKRQCKEVFRIDAVSPDDFWIERNEAYNERLWETWCESFYKYLESRPTVIQANTEEEKMK